MTARRRRTRAAAAADERYFVASQWRMMWRKLVRHRLAVIAAAVLAAPYLVAGFADFVAPAAAGTRNNDFIHAPPQRIRFFSDEGLHLRPFVYGLTQTRNMETMRREYAVDPSRRHPLRLFVRADPYELWGVIPSDVHLLGADRLGGDVLSRVIYGTRLLRDHGDPGDRRLGAIITRHLLPSFMSYLIVSVTLSIPGMILGETALSFLGLGLRAPVVSWGVLLQDAQNFRAVAIHP